MSGGPNSTRPPLAVVYGGGGPYATAFGMGVAAALLDNGVPLRSTPALGPFGSALGRQLAWEISRWKRRTGGQAYIVRPEHELGRRIKRWGTLFDGELAREAYAGAHAQTSREIAHGGSLRSAIT